MRVLLSLLLTLSLTTPVWAGASRDGNGTSSDYLTCGTPVSGFSTTASLSVHFNTDTTTGVGVFASAYDIVVPAPTNNGIQIYHNGANIQYQAGSGLGSNIAGSALTAGVWYHAVVTYNDKAVAGYLDAVADGTSTASTNAGWGATFYLFRNGDGNYSNSKVAYASLYNVVLTSQEIAELRFNPFGVSRGLAGQWMISGASSPEPDITGANDCTVTGTTESTLGPPVYLTSPLAWRQFYRRYLARWFTLAPFLG